MSAFVLVKQNEVKFEDRPDPFIKDDHDVKIRVRATGICGSDIHYWLHGRIANFVVRKPMILGHESAGEVVEIGSKVKTLKVGDRVAMEPGIPCRYCIECKQGRYNLCLDMSFASTPPYDGTLTNFYILPEDHCFRLSDSMSMEEGALMEPLSVAVHVVRLANVKIGDTVVVFGAGPVGLLCCAVAKAHGASQVISVDILQYRIVFAVKYAATNNFLPNKDDDPETNAKKIIEKFGFATGADVAIDASGATPSIASAVHVVRPGGTMIQAGMGRPDINFPIMAVCAKEMTVKGSFRYGYGDYAQSLELIRSGKVSVKKLVTHRFPFHEAEKAFEMVRNGADGVIKAVIEGREL